MSLRLSGEASSRVYRAAPHVGIGCTVARRRSSLVCLMGWIVLILKDLRASGTVTGRLSLCSWRACQNGTCCATAARAHTESPYQEARTESFPHVNGPVRATLDWHSDCSRRR